jgi:hypothetical protein
MPLREPLRQLSDATFITDGGMETTLIFHQVLELPLPRLDELATVRTGAGRAGGDPAATG